MENKERLLEIEKEQDEINLLIDEKEKRWDNQRPWNEYEEHMSPEWRRLSKLSSEARMIMPYELNEMSEYGDQMSLKEFLSNVKCGGFIDYDGYGYYTKDGKETNVIILPSDVKHKKVRKDFDSIIWFNR